MQKKILILLCIILLGFNSSWECFGLFNNKTLEEKEIISVLRKHSRAMNSHNLEKVKTFYSKDYKSADNFDLNTLLLMLEKTYLEYKNIKYKISITDIKIDKNTATVAISDQTKAKLYQNKKKNKEKAGLLEGKSNWTVKLIKENNDWKIISDEIKNEETTLKYGIAKKINMDLIIPNSIKNGETYDLMLKVENPKDIDALAAISREEITYPPKDTDDKFRRISETGVLERLVRANKNNLNEYAIASIGFTKVSVNQKEIKATIEVKGIAYIMKRINMEKQVDGAKGQ